MAEQPSDPPPQRRYSVGNLQESLPPVDSSSPRSASKLSWAGLKQSVVSAALGGSSADADAWDTADLPANFFDLSAKDASGEALPFRDLFGKAALVVNVASF